MAMRAGTWRVRSSTAPPSTASQFAAGVPLRRPTRAVRVSSSRVAGPVTRAFFSRPAVTVPLDYYRLLSIAPRAPAGAVDEAVLERVSQPPSSSAEFSAAALASRAQLLRVAGATLTSPSQRAAHDNALVSSSAVLDVPLPGLPGALLLLQECGDTAAAIALGTAALQGPSCGQEWHRDVCHALALCYADEAAAALERATPDIVAAYLCLEHVAALLSALGPPGTSRGSALRTRVEQAIYEYSPEFCLEALGATALAPRPGTDATALAARIRTRASAKRVLRQLLWSVGPDGEISPRLKAKRDDFAAQAAKLLTAAENAALVSLQPARVPMTRATALHGATAALAAGFTARDMALVYDAEALLSRVPQEADAPMLPALPPASDASPASGSDAPEGDSSSESTTDNDTTPAEPAPASTPPPSSSNSSTSSSPAMVLCTASMLLGRPEAALACVANDASAQAYISRFETPLAGGVALVERFLADGVLSRFRDTAPGAPSAMAPSLAAWFEAPPVRTALDAPAPAAALMLRARAASRAAAARAELVAEEALGAPPNYDPKSGTALLTDAAAALPPAAWALAALLAATSLLRAAGLMGGVTNIPVLGGITSAVASTTDAVVDVAMNILTPAGSSGAAAQALDVPLAAAVIRRWQAVKAAALGGRHDVGALNGVLDGPMLRQWRARAEDVRHNGFYWEYQLTGLAIDALKVSQDGSSATVEATLQEVAILHDSTAPGGRKQEQEAYESTYRARYDLIRRSSGRGPRAWRIISGSVMY